MDDGQITIKERVITLLGSDCHRTNHRPPAVQSGLRYVYRKDQAMKTWDYARCSTNEDKQDITRQIKELKAAGAEEVVFEYEHGDAKVKKNLLMLLETATGGC